MLSGHFIFPPSLPDLDRREVERGRFNNEAIRRFQDSPTDFAISQQQGISNGNPLSNGVNSAFASDDVVGGEAVAPILVKTTTFYGDGIHKQVPVYDETYTKLNDLNPLTLKFCYVRVSRSSSFFANTESIMRKKPFRMLKPLI